MAKSNWTKFVGILAIVFGLISANGDQARGASKKATAYPGNDFNYGPNGPNISYRSGPHTRVYITKRSRLDAGTEVLPGDRKFADYAFPPRYSFGRESKNRSIDHQPLNPSSDMGGFNMAIPPYQQIVVQKDFPERHFCS